MPFWQKEILRTAVGMTFAETYTLDLPREGLLGSLVLYARSTQNGQPFLGAVRKWRLIDYISKIEVIGDGAEVIKSFDGLQALASAFYDDGREPVSMWRHYSNTPHRQWVPIHFGRWFYDELYGLDLSRFNQVQLKITNDATATEFTTNITLDVVAYWQRETSAPPLGHFREEEWKIWAPAADAWEYNDLPTAHPIRRILLRARPGVDSADCINNSSMHRLMRDINFSFRTGQVTVFRGSLEHLGHLSAMDGPWEIKTQGDIDRNADIGYEVGVGYAIAGLASVHTYTAAPATFPATVPNVVQQDSTQQTQVRAADAIVQWQARGHGYNHNVPLWIAQKPDLSDMIDPVSQNQVKVDIQCQTGTDVTGTSRVAQNAIVLSRLIRR